MNKKHVLVTGGAGYIGSHICVSLIENGFTPVVVDDLSNAHEKTMDNIAGITGVKLDFYLSDIRDMAAMRGIFTKYDFAAVIHLAAKKAVAESVANPTLYYDVNMGGLIAILKIMDEFNVKHFIYSSSATVYAPDAKGIFSENSPTRPVNPYGWTKYMGEQIINDISKTGKLCAGILRYFNPVGAHKSGLIGESPKGTPNNLMPLVADVVRGVRDKITVFGNDYNTPDGTAIRDYIHVVDVAEAHIIALKKILETDKGFTLNIGTGKGSSVLEIINTYKRVNSVDIPCAIGARRAGDAEHMCADITNATALLKWKSRFNLDDMCRDLHLWTKNKKIL